MGAKEQLLEARNILTRISALPPERRIPPLSGANLSADIRPDFAPARMGTNSVEIGRLLMGRIC
jgi:hypothetical protein